MNRNTFSEYITESNFRGLFLSELGWNKPKGNTRLLPILIDDTEYTFTCVAERNGLQVVVADVNTIPTNSLARRIDAQLRKQAQDYIAIYKAQDRHGHHAWVVPVKNVDKRDLVSIEYETPSKADFLIQKLDFITFNPAETTTIVDVKEGVHKAFAVNAEKITNDFYSGFKKEHTAFARFISGIDDNVAVKDNRNKQWYASVMLNRLMFCYFIQKKGFLDGNVNYLRDKLEWVRQEQGNDRFFGSFYREFLTRLFSDGLNKPGHNSDFVSKFGRIPYLNGGMFDRHQIERDYAGIDIADDAFISLFSFFDKWQWHLDTRVTASGRDINPDVLGYIFEQYINDRAAMGAYYTKEDITEYIGRSTILPFLFDKVAKSSVAMTKLFAPNGWVWRKLQESGDRNIFDAVKQGYTPDWKERIPDNISVGLDTSKPELLERRKDWNTRTPEPWALPTEIWRETIERLQRCDSILSKIRDGEITSINDFITYNLDIRQFAIDLINSADAEQSFIYRFYDALRTVTVLDPTCGSGAFLFAAMNILEPLYYDCIMRMEGFVNKSEETKKALEEIKAKYRSNIHYFIYKSIILRNLYGVDIMAEATEIAKLRLFLKMVAVVDVDYHADNLGLDPLPDIDFNIRCGNTLVGYANADSVYADHQGDLFAAQEYRDTIEAEMNKVAAVFKIFKTLQLTQESDRHAEFIAAKNELTNRLVELNNTLNHHLHQATAPSIPYDKWLTSHQPFNWVAEFYEIIHGNGGFDVIIGNPPYVNGINNLPYKLIGYKTMQQGNLYGWCMERSVNLLQSSGVLGMIVPQSIVKMPTYEKLRKLLEMNLCHYSIFTGDTNCGVMFEGVKQNVSIVLRTLNHHDTKNRQSTRFIKFFSEERKVLFQTIKYADFVSVNITGSQLEIAIFDKVKNYDRLEKFLSKNSENHIYFRNTSGAIYKPFFDNEPLFTLNGNQVSTSTLTTLSLKDKTSQLKFLLLYNSNLFNLWWCSLSDGRHIVSREINSITIPSSINSELDTIENLSRKLMDDYVNNSTMVSYNRNNGIAVYRQYTPRKSKSIIDEIDKVLAKHYEFTEEELDFIINYDIKYRMGDELNSED